MAERLRGGVQVLDRQQAGHESGPRPADPAASARPDTQPSPVQLLHAAAEAPSVPIGPHYRRARRAGLSAAESRIVITGAVAAATASESGLKKVFSGLDGQENHPAIRTRVAEKGTMAEVYHKEKQTPGLDSGERTRSEAAVRAVLLGLNDYHSELNGLGPTEGAKKRINREAAEQTAQTVREVMTDEAMLGATIGISESRPIPDASHDIADDNDGPRPTSKDVYIPPFAEDRRRIKTVAIAKAREKYSNTSS